ncbi:MAG: fasciclin domain-containing protein [Prevotella sp.]|nr:fasciclin domain-containing protein [Prevotella sp.]
MKKLILYASLICIGMASCSKDFLVDEENLPSWLGESIYGELQNPKSLEGSFSTYLRLIDDMGYAEVLGHTGSKTIFPANDEAFAAYFRDGNNRYGATCYEDLTYSQKAQLLYSSMLDNAILIGNISTEQNSAGELLQGQAVKHQTNMQLNNSIETLFSPNFPKNNVYFDRFMEEGAIETINDNTVAPMVHFTGEYMLNNSMTVVGENNDFSVITGHEYSDGDAYIFRHKVIKDNVTCQNGYIHQLDGVLEPPGNMAQMLREDAQSGTGTSLFSRMLDYYCAPFYDEKVHNSYNAWALENKQPTIGKVYSMRYFSQNSQANKLDRYKDDDGRVTTIVPETQLLAFDPGWNYYKPTTTGTESYNSEIAAILAPTDDALWEYFKENGGGGAYIIQNLGNPSLPNTREYLGEHFDAIYNSDPTVFTNMLNNLMKAYFSKTVPSKFSTVQNDAFEFMGITLDDIRVGSDGKYDVKIANNGVIYKMNKFFAPQLYNSVLGPASVYQNMRSMGQMLNDHAVTAGELPALGVNMYYYLMSMKSKYAVFVPEDNDSFFFIDPLSIYDEDGYGLKALRFRFEPTVTDAKFNVMVRKGRVVNGSFVEMNEYEEENIDKGTYLSQIQDMLNYHVVVLNSSESGLSNNHYFKTKHGGAIYLPNGSRNNKTILGGAQVEGLANAATILTQYGKTGQPDADPEANIENGTCYLLSSPIQPTTKSTYKVLSSKFEKFFEFMSGFDGNSELLSFAGISDLANEKTGKSEQTAYTMFEGTNTSTLHPELNDMRMRMLSAYNYTLYAPTDDAMEAAYEAGLPRWSDVEALYSQWADKTEESGYAAASAKARKMIDAMRSFVFYHIQNSSVFADNTVATGIYQTFCTDELGIPQQVTIGGGGGTLTVKDNAGKTVNIVYGNENANILARDIVRAAKNTIDYSSFVTIHGINTPLCFNKSGRYDDKWNTSAGAKATRR